MPTIGCAGTQISKYEYKNDAYQVNVPLMDEDCYDASVLLNADAARTREVATRVILGLDSTISESTEMSLKAERNRHIGVFVGSGGEELCVEWKRVDDGKTFVTATTKTGFVGGAGQNPWSCKIIEKMVWMVAMDSRQSR